MKKFLRGVLLTLTLIAVLVAACACGSGGGNYLPGGGDGESDGGRVVTYKEKLQIETYDFDESCNKLIAALGDNGYIAVQNVDVRNEKRYANYVLMVKSTYLNTFQAEFEDWGKILTRYSTMLDITDAYLSAADTLQRLTDYYQFYKELYEAEKVKTPVNVELLDTYYMKMADAENELKSAEIAYAKYNKQKDYSEVTVNLYEKGSDIALEKDYGAKVSHTFRSSWKAFVNVLGAIFIGLVAAFPFLLAIGVILTIVLVSVYFYKKRKNALDLDKARKAQSMPSDTAKLWMKDSNDRPMTGNGDIHDSVAPDNSTPREGEQLDDKHE